ncbi:hypothetical protein A0257_18390 [Hymenobacter psoromatis]|nr:hypothetical protein A0257_18390 [Hymenobacter psoromatis]
MRLVGEEELVRDSIQEVFQKLWERRATLASVAAVKPYLFKALRYGISDTLKSSQRRNIRQRLYYEEEFEVDYSPEDFLLAEQFNHAQRAQLLALLNALPSRQREVLYLKYFDNFSYEKTSEVMNLTAQSVRNLIYRAIKALKALLTVFMLIQLFLARG